MTAGITRRAFIERAAFAAAMAGATRRVAATGGMFVSLNGALTPGVSGAEIWIKILPVGQPPPTNPADLSFVALDTKTPYTLDFDGADGGKNAHYMLRWVNTTGEHGPWSDTVSVTIGA